MRRDWLKIGSVFALLFFFGLYHLQSNPVRKIRGKYKVSGVIQQNSEPLAGKVTIKPDKRTGKLKVYGHYYLVREKETIARFRSTATFDGKTLRFYFFVRKVPGIVSILSSLAGGNFGAILEGIRRTKVVAEYTLQPDGKTWKGGWKAKRADLNTQETWEKINLPIRLKALKPNKVEVSSEKKVEMTILGRNLPAPEELRPSEIQFYLNGEVDRDIRVEEILEGDDEGTMLKVLVRISSGAMAGERDLHLRDAKGKRFLLVERDTLKLPLGGSVEAYLGDRVRIFIPQAGGELTIQGVSGLRLKSERGEVLTPGEDGKFKIERAGWYTLDFSESNASGRMKLKSTYRISARTPEEKTPWNFWYFPFMKKWNPKQNLYSDGGVYEKLDKILGIQGDPEGWKKFNPRKHMDGGYFKYESSRIIKLAQKYYKNGRWQQPEDESDFEFLKRHNPTTIKGWAWAYARSEDPKKSWWGHCWGAVVASSLWAQPKAKTITLPSGEKIEFSEEEVEGIITAYYTNHSVYPINYMSRCPAGRPTEKLGEDVDRYCDDFFLGLIDGILRKRVPLASNLRAESTDEEDKDQVWNHVIWKFEAELKQVEGQDDETYIEIDLKVYATSDTFPSSQSAGPRTEKYKIRLKYNTNGTVDRDNRKYQNWVYAQHFCPSYLWRITESADPYGTDNAVLRGRLKKLVELFGYQRIK